MSLRTPSAIDALTLVRAVSPTLTLSFSPTSSSQGPPWSFYFRICEGLNCLRLSCACIAVRNKRIFPQRDRLPTTALQSDLYYSRSFSVFLFFFCFNFFFFSFYQCQYFIEMHPYTSVDDFYHKEKKNYISLWRLWSIGQKILRGDDGERLMGWGIKVVDNSHLCVTFLKCLDICIIGQIWWRWCWWFTLKKFYLARSSLRYRGDTLQKGEHRI